MDNFIPTHPHLKRVWEGLSRRARARRLRKALRRESLLKRVAGRGRKDSERTAVSKLGKEIDRASFRRYKRRFEQFGLDGLFDWRVPRARVLNGEHRAAVCTLRRVDPQVGVQEILEHLRIHHGIQSNATAVKRVLREAGLARRRGPPPPRDGGASVGEVRLELGGMKLVEAAVEETGYVDALAEGVIEQRAAQGPSEEPLPLDTSGRDKLGRFEAEYNERFRKSESEAIGPGFRSVEERRAEVEPSRMHLAQVSKKILVRKLTALLCSPLVGSGRWDGIRVARGELLGELCGYPYMPATLDLFTRELKYLGVAGTLWEIHARCWLKQTRGWGEERSGAVVYIDGSTKPVWTKLFSQATPVSGVNLVMPGLEQVCFHSGYGVPLWMVTHSGRAVLVKAVPELLERMERFLDVELGRIVVIDAEGSSLPFLKGLEEVERAWVTRLRPSMLVGKKITDRTGYRAYRDGDRVRAGRCNFKDPDDPKEEVFSMRVVEVERRGTGEVTYLGGSTLLDDEEWDAAGLAGLYFDRWPKQEANFRAVSQAVGSKEVHGYGKQLVDNVTVVSRLEKLVKVTERLEKRVNEQAGVVRVGEQRVREIGRELGRMERREERLKRQMKPMLKEGQAVTEKMRALVKEERDMERGQRKLAAGKAKAEKKLQEARARQERSAVRLEAKKEEQEKLEGQRKIFRHDVELDSLFSVLKVGLVLVVSWVLKEYLGDAKMEAATFLERVATLPARLRRTPELEIVTFEYNRRDPDVMDLVGRHCEAINARKLRARSGRVLRFAVDPAPPPRNPPPRRVKSNDRFAGN